MPSSSNKFSIDDLKEIKKLFSSSSRETESKTKSNEHKMIRGGKTKQLKSFSSIPANNSSPANLQRSNILSNPSFGTPYAMLDRIQELQDNTKNMQNNAILDRFQNMSNLQLQNQNQLFNQGMRSIADRYVNFENSIRQRFPEPQSKVDLTDDAGNFAETHGSDMFVTQNDKNDDEGILLLPQPEPEPEPEPEVQKTPAKTDIHFLQLGDEQIIISPDTNHDREKKNLIREYFQLTGNRDVEGFSIDSFTKDQLRSLIQDIKGYVSDSSVSTVKSTRSSTSKKKQAQVKYDPKLSAFVEDVEDSPVEILDPDEEKQFNEQLKKEIEDYKRAVASTEFQPDEKILQSQNLSTIRNATAEMIRHRKQYVQQFIDEYKKQGGNSKLILESDDTDKIQRATTRLKTEKKKALLATNTKKK